MRLVSWNVNGLRSVLKKGFADWLAASNIDVLCLQEIKIHHDAVAKHVPLFPGYHFSWHSAEKAGYSGVAILSKQIPQNIVHGLGAPDFDSEGRVITAEYPEAFIVNVYAPNSQSGFARLPFRLRWDQALRAHVQTLARKKPVLLCGDFNVAHTPLDIGIPFAERTPGCSPQEQQSFAELLRAGFVDPLRLLHPNTPLYSWWSYTAGARAANLGLRFDYVLISSDLQSRLRAATTHPETIGSDHGPVSLELDLELTSNEEAPYTLLADEQIGFDF